MSAHRDEGWQLEKKIPIGFLLGLLGQTFFLGWYASSTSTRIEQLERQAALSAPQSERIVRLEEKLGSVQQGITEIKAMIRPAPAPVRTNDPPG